MPRDVDEMLDVIKERHRDEARRLRAAQRRLAVPINGMMFTDVATLLKYDTGWRIATKVFFRKN